MRWVAKGSLRGPAGPRGPQGQQGPAGRDGVAVQLAGFAAMYVDAVGDLWCETVGEDPSGAFEMDSQGNLYVKIGE